MLTCVMVGVAQVVSNLAITPVCDAGSRPGLSERAGIYITAANLLSSAFRYYRLRMDQASNNVMTLS